VVTLSITIFDRTLCFLCMMQAGLSVPQRLWFRRLLSSGDQHTVYHRWCLDSGMCKHLEHGHFLRIVTPYFSYLCVGINFQRAASCKQSSYLRQL
jgi:hypothetical protein